MLVKVWLDEENEFETEMVALPTKGDLVEVRTPGSEKLTKYRVDGIDWMMELATTGNSTMVPWVMLSIQRS